MQGGCASAGRVRGKDPLLRVIHVSGTILHGQLRARRGIALRGRHSEQAGKQRSETMVAAHCKTFCEPGTNPLAYQVLVLRTLSNARNELQGPHWSCGDKKQHQAKLVSIADKDKIGVMVYVRSKLTYMHAGCSAAQNASRVFFVVVVVAAAVRCLL